MHWTCNLNTPLELARTDRTGADIPNVKSLPLFPLELCADADTDENEHANRILRSAHRADRLCNCWVNARSSSADRLGVLISEAIRQALPTSRKPPVDSGFRSLACRFMTVL